MNVFVGAYWGARAEDREACAARVVDFLQAVGRQDATLLQWFKKAASRSRASVAMHVNQTGIEAQLKSHRRDIGKEVIPELGFSFAAWNGHEVSLSANVGAYSDAVGNCMVLSFYNGSSPQQCLLEEILRSMVTAFEPRDAIATSIDRMVKPPRRVWESPGFCRYKAGEGFSA